jgi:alcohol dehydrogenase (cytochrome c)
MKPVFFGDMAGRLHAADARSGRILWTHDAGGAIGGGVISYVAGGKQRIAVASGMTSPIWKTPDVTAKLVVFSRE